MVGIENCEDKDKLFETEKVFLYNISSNPEQTETTIGLIGQGTLKLERSQDNNIVNFELLRNGFKWIKLFLYSFINIKIKLFLLKNINGSKTFDGWIFRF